MDASRLQAERILEGLRPHPRLIVDQARLAEIRRLVAGDAFAAATLARCLATVEEMRRLPPDRPLRQSGPQVEETLGLLTTCSMVWRLTGDPDSLACARDHLRAICSQPPWSRDNFLAIGELAYALAIAYDWLRDDLAAADRELVRRYLVEAILAQGLAAYDEGDWWIDSTINWNHECNGGLITAALAVADTDPGIARAILPRALRWFDLALEGYDPDGGWDEGAGYWNRATIFSVFALAALDSALGNDFGLSERAGLAKTGRFFLAAIGPTQLLARYADCSDGRRVRSRAP